MAKKFQIFNLTDYRFLKNPVQRHMFFTKQLAFLNRTIEMIMNASVVISTDTLHLSQFLQNPIIYLLHNMIFNLCQKKTKQLHHLTGNK